jgi:hypothetical protein
MVQKCYFIELFRAAYGHIIYPCRGISEWPKVNGRAMFPPLYEKESW